VTATMPAGGGGEAPLRLAHVGLTVGDPEASGEELAAVLGVGPAVQVDGVTELALGHARLRLHRRDGPEGGRALGFLALAADDVAPLARRLAGAGVAFEDGRTGDGERMLTFPPDQWCGVPLRVLERPAAHRPSPPAGHTIRGIDHIGVASTDNGFAERRFGLLGLPVESRQTDTEATVRVEQFTSDKYGVRVVTREETRTASGLRVLFLSLADTDLELLQDLTPAPGAARGASSSTGGDRSAIARYVERGGPGLHHLALRVDDIDAALAQAAAGGAGLVDRAGRPGSRLARIAFLDPRTTARVLFHFVERP
jgi:methylmalonyl-CoA/ethylmalonyl-CoA epimerase